MIAENIPLARGDKESKGDYRDNLLVNYTTVHKSVKGDEGYIASHDGLKFFASGSGVDRGCVYNSRFQEHLRLSGNDFIKVNTDRTTSFIGSIQGSDQASFAYSFLTQGVLASGQFWLYDGTSFNQASDADFGSPIDVAFINGVYIFTDGENLYHTRADNEYAIDSQTFATSEFSPDRTLGLMVNKQNQVVVFNRYSTEWFVDRGGDNFRFRRVQGKSVKIGIAGTYCKVELDGHIFILGGRKSESTSIHILAGGSEHTVATREIERIIEEYTSEELSNVVLEARTTKKDKFLIVRLPNHTLLYNHSIAAKFGLESAWSIIKSGLDQAAWRGANGLFDPRLNRWLYGDSINSNIGELTSEVSSQYGEDAEHLFYTPILKLESKSINMFEVDAIGGFSDKNPKIYFSLSYDGLTYSAERSVSVGGLGDYNKRFGAIKIGTVRYSFNFKFRAVTTERLVFSGMKIDYD